MTDQTADPGPEAVERILADLEECRWSPTEVARQSRRLRAYIEGLRERNSVLEDLNDQLNSRLEEIWP